ncbi:outer membrane porin protein OmpQ [Sesbania bispinosa]|nr:outer membrane porin protein OmpQ [Sesbania bispinosa]
MSTSKSNQAHEQDGPRPQTSQTTSMGKSDHVHRRVRPYPWARRLCFPTMDFI